jgi:hypothetical protein
MMTHREKLFYVLMVAAIGVAIFGTVIALLARGVPHVS